MSSSPAARMHAACVDRWLAHQGPWVRADEALALLGRALRVLWRRAEGSLGGPVVAAIVARTLDVSAGRYRWLAALRVDEAGVRVEPSTRAVTAAERDELVAAMRFVLVEFLTVVGNVSAEILTPALHEALAGVRSGDGLPAEGASERGDGGANS